MKTLTIQIDCSNDSFVENPVSEIKRILETIPEKLNAHDYGDIVGLKDLNGNTVGHMEVIDSE